MNLYGEKVNRKNYELIEKKMLIALICPSNKQYMPYLMNYISELEKNGIEYEIINWDRFQMEDKNDVNIYRDAKIGHRRNFYDYYKFKRFVKLKLERKKYDKLVVFGLQLSFFLRNSLLKSYKDRYLLDIRDYNKILNFMNFKKLIDNSYFTAISSPGFLKWLPKSRKILVNHNMNTNNIDNLNSNTSIDDNQIINISYIGSIRDFKINKSLIDSLKNVDNINLYYHGEEDDNKNISLYLEKESIQNVFVTGKYTKEKEISLYQKSDFINILIPNKGLNNITLLPNRLYNAVKYRKKIIAFEGTFLAEQVKKFKLGLILHSFDDIEMKIKEYNENLDEFEIETGRIKFLEQVIKENQNFEINLKSFILK